MLSEKKGESYAFEVTTKDNRSFRLKIFSHDKKFYKSLDSAVFPKDVSCYTTYALKYKKLKEVENIDFNYIDDIKRMLPDGNFEAAGLEIVNINNAYDLCPSYPASLVKPKAFPLVELTSVAGFRTKCRVPGKVGFLIFSIDLV
jgi:hypothetical protein